MRATPGFELGGARGAQAAMARSRRHLATLLALFGAFSLLLSACSVAGGNSNVVQLSKDQLFSWPYVDASGIMGHNMVLDPAEITTAKDYAVVTMIYTNLVTLTPNLGIAPDAATRWDVTNDGKSYTFHLRPNMKFSDGVPITAADFAYSLDRSLDHNLCTVMGSTYAGCGNIAAAHLNYLVGADARLSGSTTTDISNGVNLNVGLNVIDPATLQINLVKPIQFFLYALTYPTGDAVEQSLIKKYPSTWVDHLTTAGTSGPFEIQSFGAGSDANKVLTLVPNPNWEQAFGKNLTLKKVVRPVVTSIDQEYSDYNAGEFEYTDVSLNQYQFASGQSDFHNVVALQTDYFAPNWDQPPFDNKEVRQAFDLALNKQLLVDSQESGGAVPTNHIVPFGMPGFDNDLNNPAPDSTQSLTGDPTAATKLMTTAETACSSSDPTAIIPDYCPYIYGNNPQPITIWAPVDQITAINIAKTAAQMWNTALHVNVRVKAATFDQIVGNLSSPPNLDPMQIWEIAWIADYPDPQDWLTIQFASNATPPNAFNSGGMHDTDFDTLVQQADTEKNTTVRMQEYNQAEQIAINDVGWIPFDQAKIAWRIRPTVHGFNLNGMGVMADLSWANVYISQS
jgi:peptide/nickel transport system substrate-binding protein/oligopeptide transport system substrate-binding protein